VIPLIAAAFVGLAIWTHAWILLWPAAVMFAVAVVYVAGAPGVFGKRRDGTIAWWAWLAWAPIFGYMRLLHELARSAPSEPAPGVVADRAYLAIPTLDATSPTPAEIVRAVDAILATGGAAFIHCAFGHGRSATVAAALLVRRGDATLDDVERKMRARRPRIGLNAHQRAALAEAVRLGAPANGS
jgi:hypothetical protein